MQDDARIERERQAASLAALDRAGADRPDRLQVMVGRVFDGGARPTTVMTYFAVHPVVPGGAEAEGGGPAHAVLSNAREHVLVLGPGVPVVGDDLVCYQVGDRWVAEFMKTPTETPVSCFPCSIPIGPLDIRYTYPGAGGGLLTAHHALVHQATLPSWITPAGVGQSFPAASTGPHYWSMDARALRQDAMFPGGGGWYRFALWCAPGQSRGIYLYYEYYANDHDPANTRAAETARAGSTCTPFRIVFGDAGSQTLVLTAP